MRKRFLSVCIVLACTLFVTYPAHAQTTPDGSGSSSVTTSATNPAIGVVAKDRSRAADQQIPWYTSFAGAIASDWARDFGWTLPRPVTVNLYTGGITMAVDAGFYRVTPLTVGQVMALSNQPTVASRDLRPIGPGGGDGGWIVGVNVNYTGDITKVADATPPAETQGHLVHDLALAMLEDVAGTGGPAWFKEGLADLLANSRVAGMNEVGQRASAWQAANGSGILPSVAAITQDWDNLTGAGGTIADASYKVADQTVYFLSQKVSVPQLVNVLQRASAGEDFEAALQSVTGYSLAQLDAAYRVTMPLY